MIFLTKSVVQEKFGANLSPKTSRFCFLEDCRNTGMFSYKSMTLSNL